jgi:hypothetical protein
MVSPLLPDIHRSLLSMGAKITDVLHSHHSTGFALDANLLVNVVIRTGIYGDVLHLKQHA